MPEERTRLSRRALLSAGASGAAILATGALSVATTTPAHAAQIGWRWCHQCQSLWWPGNGLNVLCPSDPHRGRFHSTVGSGNYVLYEERDGHGGQRGWRWCPYCQGLWYSGNGDNGTCIVRGRQGHTSDGSGRYTVNPQSSAGGAQLGWAWCTYCNGLWYGFNTRPDGSPDKGACPIPTVDVVYTHSWYGSDVYGLHQT